MLPLVTATLDSVNLWENHCQIFLREKIRLGKTGIENTVQNFLGGNLDRGRSPSAAASSSPGKSTKIGPSNALTSLKLHEMALLCSHD
jgi:hypothetical protein